MKYNRSNIARRANALARTMDRSAAWKTAWAEAKMAVAESALFVLGMKDRMDAADFDQARELRAEIAKQRAAIKEASSTSPGTPRRPSASCAPRNTAPKPAYTQTPQRRGKVNAASKCRAMCWRPWSVTAGRSGNSGARWAISGGRATGFSPNGTAPP